MPYIFREKSHLIFNDLQSPKLLLIYVVKTILKRDENRPFFVRKVRCKHNIAPRHVLFIFRHFTKNSYICIYNKFNLYYGLRYTRRRV